MDGLLFDTERIYQETWREIAEERRITLDGKFAGEIAGTNGSYMCRVIERYYQVSDGASIERECKERVKDKLSVYVPVKEGAGELICFFRETGIRMAVASSSSLEQIEANLKKAGFREYFEVLLSGAEVERGKPAPDIFRCAAKRLGLLAEECLVFEDSENGVRAGYAAGCGTIMVPDVKEADERIIPCCLKICKSLAEAQKAVKDLLYFS